MSGLLSLIGKNLSHDTLSRRTQALMSRITKEPLRHEFRTKAEFLQTWENWRDIRNRNNIAVSVSDGLGSGVLLTHRCCGVSHFLIRFCDRCDCHGPTSGRREASSQLRSLMRQAEKSKPSAPEVESLPES